jgi:Family of unknown function (DUF6159)
MGRISRGWELTKQSWEVLKRDMSLMWFPILASVFAILAAAAIWVPTAITEGVFDDQTANEQNAVFYIATAAAAYVSTVITIFFNVALAACAVRSMRGEDTKVSEGIKAAMARIGPILGWSLVATTVNLILRALEERVPLAGRIAVWIAGATWAIATFFVIPVVALEGTGPVRSLERSAKIVKARWGEGATGAATIGVVTFLVTLLVVAVGAVGSIVVVDAGLPWVGYAIMAAAVLAVIGISIVSSTLTQIFRVALYEFAVSGQTPGGFDGPMLQAAFKPHRA